MASAADKFNEIQSAIELVKENIQKAFVHRTQVEESSPTLIAVSKTKPIEDVISAYKTRHEHFGENYVQELEEKSKSDRILEECPDIKWHFVGHIQSKKVKSLIACPNLYMIETISSVKLAESVNKHWKNLQKPGKLKVMVQVNSSREEQKSGIMPEEATELINYIRTKCDSLKFCGLMTIGALGWNPENGSNPDFLVMLDLRKQICIELELDEADVALSMGMSSDYIHAVELGSSYVRVGSTIFGAREYKKTSDSKGDNTSRNLEKISTDVTDVNSLAT